MVLYNNNCDCRMCDVGEYFKMTQGFDELSITITQKSIELNDFYRLNNTPSLEFPNGWISDEAEEIYFIKLRDIQDLMNNRNKQIDLIDNYADKVDSLTKYREASVTSSTYERSKNRIHKNFKNWRTGK